MENFEEFEIQFASLPVGKHFFQFDLDNSFFELFDYHEFNDAKVHVELQLEKKQNGLDLHFLTEGWVNVNCDVTNEPYDQPIDGSYELVVKFSDHYDDDNEEVLILPHHFTKIRVQQPIYETVILAVPYKKVHPGILDGSLDSEILDKLEELAPGHSKRDKEETDPRWDKLKDLLNEK